MDFIPDDIIDVIIKYVDNKHLYDCNKYLNSSKYYNFNKKYSLKYYDNAQFRKLVQLKIPKNKLSLNLSHCKNITDVSILGELHKLDLSCSKITDVSMLGTACIDKQRAFCFAKDARFSIHDYCLLK